MPSIIPEDVQLTMTSLCTCTECSNRPLIGMLFQEVRTANSTKFPVSLSNTQICAS